MQQETFDELIILVTNWAENKDLLKKEHAYAQALKVLEEIGETAGALLKNNEEGVIDGIGDVFVTLIILCKQLGLNPTDCLNVAWQQIKDRTGETINGTFIKTSR